MDIILNNCEDQQRHLSEKLDKYMRCKHIIDPTIEALGPLVKDVSFPGSIDLSITGNKDDLRFLFKTLRSRGWNTQFRPTAHAASYSGFWDHEDSELQIWVNFHSSVCKLVRTGTKLVEQPVYEVVCSDDEIGEEA
jgi:hypothetical protein